METEPNLLTRLILSFCRQHIAPAQTCAGPTALLPRERPRAPDSPAERLPVAAPGCSTTEPGWPRVLPALSRGVLGQPGGKGWKSLHTRGSIVSLAYVRSEGAGRDGEGSAPEHRWSGRSLHYTGGDFLVAMVSKLRSRRDSSIRCFLMGGPGREREGGRQAA